MLEGRLISFVYPSQPLKFRGCGRKSWSRVWIFCPSTVSPCWLPLWTLAISYDLLEVKKWIYLLESYDFRPTHTSKHFEGLGRMYIIYYNIRCIWKYLETCWIILCFRHYFRPLSAIAFSGRDFLERHPLATLKMNDSVFWSWEADSLVFFFVFLSEFPSHDGSMGQGCIYFPSWKP